MREIKILINLMASIAAAVVMIGCSQDVMIEAPTMSGSLELCVAEFDLGNVDSGSSSITRAVEASSTTDLSSVKNLWVIEYESDGDFIASTYYENFVSADNIELDSDVSRIIFLANTFDDELCADSPTVADVKALEKEITTIGDVLSTSGEDQYIVMSGEIAQYDPASSISVTLRRNVAKINIKVSHTGVDSSWAFDGINICNVPSSSRLYTNYSDCATIAPTKTFEYNLSEQEVSDATGESGVTLYLPINEQGTVSDNSSSIDKVVYALDNATYIELAFTNYIYTRSYTFYLGANTTTDYNISANKNYNFTFDIDGMGNSTTDPRIDVYIDYETLFVPIVNVTEVANWKSENKDLEQYLVTEFFDFAYSAYEVYGTNFRSDNDAIAAAGAIDLDTGYPENEVSEYDIQTDDDVSDDVLPRLQEETGEDVTLPTIEELMYIYIFLGNDLTQVNVEGYEYYWSSTISDTNSRWGFDLGFGNTRYRYIEEPCYARAVRTISGFSE